MFAFVATPAGFVSRLDTAERSIIARLVDDVAALIADGAGAPHQELDARIAHLDFDPAEPPGDGHVDPALMRLFPPMSVSDPELAAEMRMLTVGELRRSKLENLAVVARAFAAGSETVVVARGEELRWLAALTDVRLVLAARLGIEDDADSRRVHDLALTSTRDAQPGTGDDDRFAALASLYSGITWWQESLLLAVTGDRRAI